MITKTFVTKLKREIERADTERSKIVRETNGYVREAKHAIFSLHRGEVSQAAASLRSLEGKLGKLAKQAEKERLRGEGSLKAAVEEFLEALYFYRVFEKKPLNAKISFAVGADEQLAALSDLTGELVRAATLEVTRGNVRCVAQYRNATEELFGALLSMNLRGSLRQKRDEARRNLKRLEEILYDVSLKS